MPLGDLGDALGGMPVAGLVVAVLRAVVVVVAVFSTGGYVLAFWGYRLTRHPGGTLHVDPRAAEHARDDDRGAAPARGRAVRAAAAALGRRRALRRDRHRAAGRPRRRARRLAAVPARPAGRGAAASPAEVLRTGDPLTAPLTPHGPRATRRRFTRALAGGVAIVAAVVVLAAVVALAHLGVGGLGRDPPARPRPSPPTAPAASATP